MSQLPLSRTHVLVMHGDPLLSAGLVAALRQDHRFEVLVPGSQQPSADAGHLDVVVTDYCGAMRLAAADGQARGLGVRTRILALTANEREADIRRAIEAGVLGYLLVGTPLAELVDGVVAVGNGMRYLSLSVARRMADSLTRAQLTSREAEVLRLVVSGYPNKEIARQLHIELGTVKSHMSTIMAKLGANSRTHAASIAASRGLVGEAAETERPVRNEYPRRSEAAGQYA